MIPSPLAPGSPVRVMFGGDAMLGRGVGAHIQRYSSAYPLAAVADLMRSADLTVVNLECAITSSAHRWPGRPKAFYFGAPPAAVESLALAGVDLVSLANNHVLDFDVDGLRETFHLLRQHAIHYAGAGESLDRARAPAMIDRAGIHFGMAAFCDHQEDFSAAADRPGMSHSDFADVAATMKLLRTALDVLERASVDWPILSLHWGPNMVVRPSPGFRTLAHAAIDMGWKILFGHSAHVFQGIEIYRGCPIIYAAGDLVDDYYVDPEYRNDHQLLFELELGRNALQGIRLYPIFIENCRTEPATDEQHATIVDRATLLCAELGTRVHQVEGEVLLEVA